jgi:hypothetical protein
MLGPIVASSGSRQNLVNKVNYFSTNKIFQPFWSTSKSVTGFSRWILFQIVTAEQTNLSS